LALNCHSFAPKLLEVCLLVYDLIELDATPETLGISVAAQDGSWTGSISESPDYRFYQPNGAKCDGAYGCDQAELTVPKG